MRHVALPRDDGAREGARRVAGAARGREERELLADLAELDERVDEAGQHLDAARQVALERPQAAVERRLAGPRHRGLGGELVGQGPHVALVAAPGAVRRHARERTQQDGAVEGENSPAVGLSVRARGWADGAGRSRAVSDAGA